MELVRMFAPLPHGDPQNPTSSAEDRGLLVALSVRRMRGPRALHVPGRRKYLRSMTNAPALQPSHLIP